MERTAVTPPLLFPLSPLLVALLSATGLGYQLAVTRIFSLYFQYHYVFLAVALGVLGVSVGAALATQAGSRRKPTQMVALLPLVLGLLSLAFVVGNGISVWAPGVINLPVQALLALLPFSLIGFGTALLFAAQPAASSQLYAADLTGAAVGVVAVLGLLTLWSPFSVMLLLAALLGITALLYYYTQKDKGGQTPWQPGLLAVITLVSVGAWAANLSSGWLDFAPERLVNPPRDKTMLATLTDPTQQARITQTLWSPFARVDVVETSDPSAKFVFTDGGAGSYMLRFDGDLAAVGDLRTTPEFLPFTAQERPNTLILGAGAGKDIVLALLAGAPTITAVEVNPAVVAATRADAAYNGNILDRPEVELLVGDARTFVERNQTVYDLIYLNLVYTQAAEPTSLALVENYIFTVEAFQRYFERLTPNGYLAIITHNALEGSRAMITALQALDGVGIAPAQALDHLALWMRNDEDPTLRTSVLLLGKSPLPPPLLQRTTTQAQALDLQPLFLPGQFEMAFAPLRQGMSLNAFVQADAAYNLSATDDNRPFFFHLDWGLPPAISQGIYIAALLLLALVGLALRERSNNGEWPWWAALLYVLLIGIGFMWIETPLIQRLQLLLGYPVLALATVLGALLLAGGIGSYLSKRWFEQRGPGFVRWAALWVAGLALLYWLLLPTLLDLLLPLPFAVRFVAAALLAALPGLGLGMPFPALLRRFPASPQKVALLWSVNGVASVLGSLLAVAIAMTYGFGATQLGGAALYALLAVFVWRIEE
ncbi:MAG: hypothetical protein DYG89_28185 [Caldilinea sp. CFX5]|nr:hypothetical protein [Caldilinea sp. CFX5]